MPELPEVERAASLLRSAIAGRTLRALTLLHPSLRRRVSATVLHSLAGARIVSVIRRGKHQLVALDDGRTVHVHFRMNGDWTFDRASDPLPRFARAVLELDDGSRVVLEDSRALCTVDVHPAGAELGLDLGPEPSDPAFTAEWMQQAFARRTAPVKSVLLDQRVIAGLGNIYAAEALWRAKLDPRAPASSLGARELARLRDAILRVVERATGTRYSEARSARLDVYDREGRKCRRCGTAIARIVQSGRSTYFCPTCQRRGTKVSRAPRAARL
jgi:formamidopyrimidine-DNA glycosylase